jgi:WD40 repeat protein
MAQSSAPPSPRSKLALLLADTATGVISEVVTALTPELLEKLQHDFDEISAARSHRRTVHEARRSSNGMIDARGMLGADRRGSDSGILESPTTRASKVRHAQAVSGDDVGALTRIEFVELLEHYLTPRDINGNEVVTPSLRVPLSIPSLMPSSSSANIVAKYEDSPSESSLSMDNMTIPYKLFPTPALHDRKRRLATFSTLFDYCDTTGANMISYEQLAGFITNCAASGALTAPVVSAIPPFRLDRVLTALPSQKEFDPMHALGLVGTKSKTANVDSIRDKLGASASIRKLICLRNVNLLAATDTRSADITLLKLDTLQFVGTLKSAGSLTASATAANVEAAIALPGYFKDGTLDVAHCYAVTAATDATMTIWNISPGDSASFSSLFTWSSYYAQQALTFNDRYNTLFSGCVRGPVRAWNIQTGEQRVQMEGHGDSVCDLVNLGAIDAIASCSHDKTIRIWDVVTSRQRTLLQGHTNSVVSLAYSPQYRVILSGGHDHNVCVWNPFVAKPVHTLTGHKTALVAVRASPYSPEMISADRSGQLICWDMRTWRQLYSWNVGAQESQPVQDKYVPTTKKVAMAASLHKRQMSKSAAAKAVADRHDMENSMKSMISKAERKLSVSSDMSSIPTALDILPTARYGALDSSRVVEAPAGEEEESDDEAAGPKRPDEANNAGSDGSSGRFTILAALDYCVIPAKVNIHVKPQSGDANTIMDATNNSDSSFTHRYAAIRRRSLTRLSQQSQRDAGDVTRRNSVRSPEEIKTATGLRFSLPPPLFGVPRLAGLNLNKDGTDSMDTLDDVVSAGAPQSGATSGSTDAAQTAVSSASSASVPGTTSGSEGDPPPGTTLCGNLFVAARCMFTYRQSSDPGLEERAATQAVISAHYLAYDQSVLIAFGRDIEIWCMLTGVRKRVFSQICTSTILCVQVYAGGKRVVVGDQSGSLIAFSTLTGAPLLIFDSPGVGELAAITADPADSATVVSVSVGGTLNVYVDPEVEEMQVKAAAAGEHACTSWFHDTWSVISESNDLQPRVATKHKVKARDFHTASAAIVPRLVPKAVCDISGNYATHDTMKFHIPPRTSAREIHCIAMSRRCRLACIGGNDQSICIFDIETGKVEFRMGTAGDVLCAKFLEPHPLLAIGDSTGTVSIVGMRTTGRSYGLLAAFRNQPLAFAALYTAMNVPFGNLANPTLWQEDMKSWSALASARVTAIRDINSTRDFVGISGVDDDAVGILSSRSDFPETARTGSPPNTARGGSPATARSGSLVASKQLRAKSPSLAGVPNLRLPVATASAPKTMEPTARSLPKPGSIVCMDFCSKDSCLTIADDSGTVSSWNLTKIISAAALAAAASVDVAKGAPSHPTRLMRAPSSAQFATGSSSMLPDGIIPILSLGFPNGGISVQTAIALLDTAGAAPGTFPVQALQALMGTSPASLATRLNSRTSRVAHRGSVINGGIADPSLAMLPALKHVAGSDGLNVAAAATPLPGPELVQFMWANRTHSDNVSGLQVVWPGVSSQQDDIASCAIIPCIITSSYDRTVRITGKASGKLIGMLAHSTTMATAITTKGRDEYEGVPAGKMLQLKRGKYWNIPVNSEVVAVHFLDHISSLQTKIPGARHLRENAIAASKVPMPTDSFAEEAMETARGMLTRYICKASYLGQF